MASWQTATYRRILEQVRLQLRPWFPLTTIWQEGGSLVSLSVSELHYSWKGWDVGRNKEFILWLKFIPMPSLLTGSSSSPALSPHLHCRMDLNSLSAVWFLTTYLVRAGSGFCLLKILELSQLPVCRLIFTCWWEEPHSKANNMIDAWTGVNGENIDWEGALVWGIRGCLPERICH